MTATRSTRRITVPTVGHLLTLAAATRHASGPHEVLNGWDYLLEATATATVGDAARALARAPDAESATLIQDAISETLALAVTERELKEG